MQFANATEDGGWGRLPRLLTRIPRLLQDVRSHRQWILLFLCGRLLPVRRLVGLVVRLRQGAPVAAVGPSLGDLVAPDPEAVAAALVRDGICLGLRLSREFVAEVRDYARGRPCYGGVDWNTRFDPDDHEAAERRAGQPLLVGHFRNTEQDCPAIARLARSPWMQDVAGRYFGAPATLIETRLWWSFASASPNRAALKIAAQDSFHFDLADWQQLKFFFYLTDVGPGNGPHIAVRGSHARRPLSHQLTLFTARTEAEIVAAYGRDAIETITGPAGFGFAEDPFAFHTGTTVREGRRLMLEISFGVTGMLREHSRQEALRT